MIHRKFFPILGYLGQQVPAVDDEIRCHPKLLHIEKQFCALMVATHKVEDRIIHKETSIMQFPEAARKLPLVWLTESAVSGTGPHRRCPLVALGISSPRGQR